MARAIFVSLRTRFASVVETVPGLDYDFLPPSPSLALDRTINARPPDLTLLTTEPSLGRPPDLAFSFRSSLFVSHLPLYTVTSLSSRLADKPTFFFPVIPLSFPSPSVAIFVCTVVLRFLPEHLLLRSVDEEPVHLICFALLSDVVGFGLVGFSQSGCLK